MKQEEKQVFKIETAKIGNVRLVPAKPTAHQRPTRSATYTREMILRIIEALKNL